MHAKCNDTDIAISASRVNLNLMNLLHRTTAQSCFELPFLVPVEEIHSCIVLTSTNRNVQKTQAFALRQRILVTWNIL